MRFVSPKTSVGSPLLTESLPDRLLRDAKHLGQVLKSGPAFTPY